MINSYNSPGRRLAGLGDWAPGGMTPDDIVYFLGRHPDTVDKVRTFQEQVAADGYIQGESQYVIPEWGISVVDPVFGNVVIFPDASGALRYTGEVPGGIATQINKPPYVPPAQPGPLDMLNDLAQFGKNAEKALSWLPYVLVAGGALWVLSQLPRRR